MVISKQTAAKHLQLLNKSKIKKRKKYTSA